MPEVKMLENYEPKSALRFFQTISLIPRGSDNEKEISDYLLSFAKERNLSAHRDDALNVIIKKPGNHGFENRETIIIQAHVDMVCEKNAETEHDFTADPIKLLVDGDFLKARGTTLGADNGAGVAMALALLDSADIPHPPLEILLTTGEEIGLLGAVRLDSSLLEGKILINLDSSQEGFFYASCAGGGRVELSYPLEYNDVPSGYSVKTLRIQGLKGGHSGIDITGRANSNRLMGRMIKILSDKFPLQFSHISGGLKDNAIPRESQAFIAFPQADGEALACEIKRIEKIFKNEHHSNDDGIEVSLKDCPQNIEKVFTKTLCSKIISALLLLPNGVQAMSLAFKDLPETSLNIGVVATSENAVSITSCIRSAVSTRKEMLVDQIATVAEVTGAQLTKNGFYPAWEYNENSLIREKAMRIFEEMFGKKPLIKGTHGGLECGILSEKISGSDIISFGPDIYDLHTPQERMSISSFGRMWEFLKKLLGSV